MIEVIGTSSWQRVGVLISTERDRQNVKFGWHENPDSGMANGIDDRRLTILAEEFGEVAEAILENDGSPEAEAHLRDEIVQVAAVAVAWLQAEIEKGRWS